MKIKRYHMEDWLNATAKTRYNLSASGVRDFYMGEFLEICGAGNEDFSHLYLGDNDTRGSRQLREEICKTYDKTGIREVMVTNGTSEAIFCFLNQVLEKGDEVVIPFPAFQCLYQIPVSIGCRLRFINLMESENQALDLEQLERTVTKKTRLIIVNNPHNPIGWTLTREHLERIGYLAKKNDSYLLFDEHYRYIPLSPGTASVPSGYDLCKTITGKTYAAGSMIKCFGIVGIRIGWLLGEPGLLSRCRDYKDYLTHTIPAVTDYIAYLALKNRERIIELKKADILKNIELLSAFMERNIDVFHYNKPTGGVVCFPGLKNEKDTAGFCRDMLHRYEVSLLPGQAFEVPGHFRINFGVKSGEFNEALERVQLYIDSKK